MSKDFLWDSGAASQISKKTLDKYFADNKVHYLDIVKPLWGVLSANCESASFLKPGDLYDVLVPTLLRDDKLKQAFKTRGLPWGSERSSQEWLSWFSHYVVESLIGELKGATK